MKKGLLFILLSFFSSTFIVAQMQLPYTEDFENGANGWVDSTVAGSSWELGFPSTPRANTTHSGNNCWDVDLDNYYSTSINNESYLISPIFSTNNILNLNLSFWQNNETNPSLDGFYVQYSLNNSVWLTLGTNQPNSLSTNWYNDSLTYHSTCAWSGHSNGWIRSNYYLNFLNVYNGNIRFRFVFKSNATGGPSSDGVSIDDFAIDTIPLNQVSPLEIYSYNYGPLSPCLNLPEYIYFYVYGTAEGYANGDTINININFGDGIISDVHLPVINRSFFTTFPHYYAAIGTYSLLLTATGPDGNSDSLIKYNTVVIEDTCFAVEGRVYLDNDTSCTFYATTDSTINSYMIFIKDQNNNLISVTHTDSLGFYHLRAGGGLNYSVGIYSLYQNICPFSLTYPITSLPSYNNDFALQDSGGFDLRVNINCLYHNATHDTIYMWLNVDNYRTSPQNGVIKLIIPPSFHYSSISTPPDSIINDTIYFSFPALSITHLSESFFYVFAADSVWNTNDTLCFYAKVFPVNNDKFTPNNYAANCISYPSPFDPNFKTVSPEGSIPNDTTLIYSIAFQNTGTDTALNVIIRDTIDFNLDLQTFTLIAFSHELKIDYITNGVVRFSFNNIMLPDSGANQSGSHGFVTYSIKPKQNLQYGIQITNTAAIYFDFNQPIITNTTINTIDTAIQITGINNYKKEMFGIIYPNPFTSEITIKSNVGHLSFELNDLLGRNVFFIENIESSKITFNKLIPGIYHYKLTSKEMNVMQYGKLIKQ